MQIHCYNCHRPFALSREAVHAALDEVVSQSLKHYSATCPHCRRLNRISRKALRRAAPQWEPRVEETRKETVQEKKEE